MPRRRKLARARPTPIQLPLFAGTASLVRIRPALHEWRYYRMEIWPDLFGRRSGLAPAAVVFYKEDGVRTTEDAG